ncbi:hypothetical protein FRC17_000838 [Serendipita sp. 399]|nr:hypothetical protein FRC17_000838 [Serendipita sp. 399]
MGTTIADFDPLFDDEAFAESLPSLPTMSASASKQAFTLSLPTFEKPPPIAEQAYFGFSSLGDSTPAFAESSDFFDQNVGTIALPGSHSVSEHPLIPIASTSSSTGVTEATDSQPYIETSEGSQSGRPKSSTAVAKKRVKKRSGVRKEKGKVKDVSYSSQSACDAALERLAQDPNVMPLLQAIVEYVYRAKLIPELPQASAATSASDAHLQSASSSHSTSIPSGSHPSPFKRRKLNRIPAGAEDWAIPFPFQQGHEPKQYMQRWDSRKMVLLLQSLLRNLRNWKSQHGLIRVRPQPTARNLRFDKDRPPTRRSNAPKDTSTAEEAPGETDTGVGSLFDPDFLAQIGQIDVGVIDQLLMSLPTDGMLEGISNQSQDTPSSTSLNLPALFGATALDSAWAEADPQRSISPLVLDLMHTSDNQQLDASMAVGQAETGFFNNESLYATGDMTSVGSSFLVPQSFSDFDYQSSHLGLHFPELFANEKQIPDYQPDVQMDIGPIDPLLIEMDSNLPLFLQ